MTPVADAIRAMQDRLGRPEWWLQRAFRAGNAVCLVGALNDVTGVGPSGRWPRAAVRDELLDFLIEVGRGWSGSQYVGLAGLNDTKIKDHSELMLFLDAALDVAEAEGL